MWKWLKKWLRWLFPKKPGRVKNLGYNMTDRTLTWDLPQVSARQAPILHTRIDFRTDTDLPWTTQDTIAADAPQQLVFADVQPGTFFYRATVVDVDMQEGEPVETAANLAFDPPGSVSNFTATDS